jgi:hypothetical protein
LRSEPVLASPFAGVRAIVAAGKVCSRRSIMRRTGGSPGNDPDHISAV